MRPGIALPQAQRDAGISLHTPSLGSLWTYSPPPPAASTAAPRRAPHLSTAPDIGAAGAHALGARVPPRARLQVTRHAGGRRDTRRRRDAVRARGCFKTARRSPALPGSAVGTVPGAAMEPSRGERGAAGRAGTPDGAARAVAPPARRCKAVWGKKTNKQNPPKPRVGLKQTKKERNWGTFPFGFSAPRLGCPAPWLDGARRGRRLSITCSRV